MRGHSLKLCQGKF
ncbi:hypothetical protein RLOC_00013615 [Lonchura striata]|uniref:Uncharacterized protein n=1 Tax=Lonchura striata TaxID=40157 RepID=A0A218VE06_9PASE|nr:hypothetical protein RLOC_00013615 [Lonchura striata domestica]